MDMDSQAWLAALAPPATARDATLADLHEMLLKVAIHEAYRRGPSCRIGGPELDDLAYQAANDAMVALLRKLDTFRGESRFTTWAYRFVVLEVTNKLGRHFWRTPGVSLEHQQWERLPDKFARDPLAHAQQRELLAAVQRAMNETLTERQRHFFLAIVINDVPIDVVASQAGSNRGAIYKIIFDSRRKIRAYLSAQGYLDGGTRTTHHDATE